MRDDLDFLKGKKPPEKRVPLNFRVPESLMKQIDVLLNLRKAQAEADGDDPEDVERTFVCENLMRLGLDIAWGRIVAALKLEDEGFPSTPERVEELIEALKSLPDKNAADGETKSKR